MEKKLELHLAELLYKTEGEDIICQGKETGKKKQTKSYSRTEICMKERGKTCQRTVVTLST